MQGNGGALGYSRSQECAANVFGVGNFPFSTGMFTMFLRVATGQVVHHKLVNLVQHAAVNNALADVLRRFVLGRETKLERHVKQM